ncbi:alpha-ketoacid dehydrogenase subunit beta [Paludibaculum fermentans]|uniref:alpha-ketoacid dehydrogenase subunit beta n=1 Tax=Paludibaculum fermentans TaxID=1473598 RepID=UPI003EB90BE7
MTDSRDMQYVEAGVEALREEMRRDPAIFYIGQGIGPRGGNYKQTKGLWEEFGETRVRDTPISELGQVGIGVGSAMAGARPIVDLVFLDMIMEAMGQVVEQAATIHYTSNGRIRVPLVIRAAMGTVRSTGPHHSRCMYSWFAHIPGLKVVLPASAEDVKGLMKTAIRDDGPVLFIEHKFFYNKKGTVPGSEYLIPFGQAKVCRTGKSMTLLAMSLMVWHALEAAAILQREGIDVEVIDPRTIVPLDEAAILESVHKTGRLLVVDEAQSFCGFSAEAAALVAERAFDDLDAPVSRLCAMHTPHPFNPVLEAAMLPSVDKIVNAARALMAQ